MTAVVFWLAVGLIFYTYAGYPLLMLLLARISPKRIKKAVMYPKVTVIIAAYNEEKNVSDKLNNVLSCQYPEDALTIIVGSDASTDQTDQIVRQHPDPRVSLIRVEGRQGKTQVQNVCAAAAEGQFLIFTDATTLLEQDAIGNIVKPFVDPGVGAVAGKLVYQQQKESSTGRGGVSYWEYETALKYWESEYNTLIGVSGCFYAVRKSDYRDVPAELISDFVIALDMVKRKRRVVLEPAASCYESTLEKSADELQMRVRVILRSLVAIRSRRELLNPSTYGAVSLSLWSHKVFRYLLPVFLLAALAMLPFLLESTFYRVVFILAIVGIVAAVLGMLGKVRNKLFVLAGYLLLTNLASLIALWQFVLGKNVVVWTPQR